uniref:Helicase ATP-binding domain-containing protein n=1 Tax=Panagrolaimus sp. JU765 TaxID=591449 RepID=A0AC34RDG6_9BILA
MHVVEVENVPIEFPFEPYECQKKFMTNVIKALQTGNNAALESPTGTGKTLSLLCASLAWLEQYKATSNPSLVSQISGPNTVATTENSQLYPTIIYASRTHSQLQQVVRELNKTRYKYMKACVLASRDQLCINEKVLKEPNSQVKGQICRNLVKAHKCIYSNTLEKDLPRIDEMYKAECANVPDIEDLITIAKKFKHCPYFRTQNVSEKADLILMPYNYVFDPKVRKAMKVNLKGNILIIDEAHNLESTCEDSISIEWSSKDLALCIDEVKKVLELLVEDEELKKLEGDTNEVSFHQLNPMEVLKKEKEPKLNMNDVAILLKNLQDLDEVLYEFGEGKNYEFKPQEIANGLSGQVFPGEQMIKFMKACVLASRDQLCINEKVLKEPNSQVKGQICRNLVKAHKCIYSNTLEKDLPRIDEMYKAECADVPDIEDLITIAKKFKHCPYFRTQNVSEKADLILMPYNYVFDPKVRKAMKVNLKGNILIIDEAHNLESTCEDSISIEWSSKDLALCIDEVKKVLELLVEDEELKKLEGDTNEVSFHQLNPMEVLKKEKEPKLNMNDVAILLKNLQDLDEVLYEFGEGKNYAFKPQEIANGLSGQVFPGEQMIKLLEKANFHRSQRDAFLNVMDQIGFYLAKKAGDNGGLWAEKGIKLSEFSALIARVFSDTFEASDKPITKTSANEACEKYLLYKTKEDDAVVLKYWCFSASVAMRLVNSRGLKSVIVASGTLSPLPAFTASLGIHFEYTLENLHIAKSNQVLVGALEKGPNNTVLFGSFQNRSNENYIKGIAQTLLRTMETTPQGMLVFFASYTQMKSMISSFINLLADDGPSYWTKMEKLKKLFIEPKDKKDLPKLMADFDQAIRGDFGAALFAVCRGKISEGIDLPDSHCRAVFIIGVPFSPMNDPRVILKKKFLQMQQLKIGNQRIMLTPDQWYEQEAYRAVNQAIGRVIRHKDDFGIVVLADSRFVYNSNR